ncbi:hypothetical protein G6F56_008920 [Rhizopus delemar]|uniref:Uncharacterized protein n=1 Tax=Rhizopus stolonifer TaxID=4846 RepID=A0A367ISD3_RHIST|nr:hypothetical protein G6F56_008920 [Rhizopus delemar]RCH80539.1 hypothetical protein CU098_005014 [Rhizopus stolonifer]
MSITQTKDKLAEAISIHERLSQEIENNTLISTLNDEEWANYLRTLGHDTAKLIQSSRLLDNDNLITMLQNKQKRLKRHKAWKKRSKKKQKRQQILTEKQSKQWVKEMEWQVTMARPIERSENKEEKETKAKIKQLTKKLNKLTLLRKLRRKKLESQGHFFAEDGNDFFNKIKEWHEQQQQQQEEKDMVGPAKELVVDKQDAWKDEGEIDQNAYKFWCESNQSLDALLRIRKHWDKYIMKNEMDERDSTGKIPPTFVTPSPPANWIWASCLL